MSQLDYKPISCKNCGHSSHCGTAYWREERDYDGGHNIIEVCKFCRCDTCIVENYQDA